MSIFHAASNPEGVNQYTGVGGVPSVKDSKRAIKEIQARATGGSRRVMNIDHLMKLSDKGLSDLHNHYGVIGSIIPQQRIHEEQQRRIKTLGGRHIRSLHLRNALGTVRTELWDGREHLVVPMVALMEGVIHAVNATTPEFVSADALRASVDKWNGHPIVVGHPTRDGKQISAHDPAVLERHGCGFIRSTAMNGARLGMEALIDPARLEKLGHKALADDLRAGTGCEVSVGAFVGTNGTNGVHGGKKYQGEWTEIGPDHTALLPGGVGACSMEMGCGAHRMALRGAAQFWDRRQPEAYLVTAEGFEALYTTKSEFDSLPELDNHVAKMLGGPGSGPHAAGDRVVVEAPSSNHHGKVGTISSSKGSVHSVSDMHGNQLGKFSSSQLKAAGAQIMDLKKLKAKMLALFDTPEQAASEEAAELVAYNAMRALFDGVGNQWDEASGLIDELIADEEENPTITAGQEEAEEEVETARLDAIRMLCYAMSSALQNVISATYSNALTDDMPPMTDPRYMEALRTAIGKTISAKNMKTVQAAHDSSHDMHAHTVALGAECNGMKLLAAKSCETCDGMGQIKTDGKQADCSACGGTGTMKTVESGAAAKGETIMTAEQKAAALKTLGACGCKTDSMTDDQIFAALTESVGKSATELKTAQDAKDAAEAKLKTAETKQADVDAKLAAMQPIVAEHEARVAAEKMNIVKALEATKVLSLEKLNELPIEQLRTMAAFARVEQPADYSGRGTATPRAAVTTEDFTPPNPYEAEIKALQGLKAVN